jgi:hypothetical protein
MTSRRRHFSDFPAGAEIVHGAPLGRNRLGSGEDGPQVASTTTPLSGRSGANHPKRLETEDQNPRKARARPPPGHEMRAVQMGEGLPPFAHQKLVEVLAPSSGGT